MRDSWWPLAAVAAALAAQALGDDAVQLSAKLVAVQHFEQLELSWADQRGLLERLLALADQTPPSEPVLLRGLPSYRHALALREWDSPLRVCEALGGSLPSVLHSELIKGVFFYYDAYKPMYDSAERHAAADAAAPVHEFWKAPYQVLDALQCSQLEEWLLANRTFYASASVAALLQRGLGDHAAAKDGGTRSRELALVRMIGELHPLALGPSNGFLSQPSRGADGGEKAQATSWSQIVRHEEALWASKLWLGSRGVNARLHLDASHNLYSQIAGKKTFLLLDTRRHYQLDVFPFLHPGSRQSRIPIEQLEVDLHADQASARIVIPPHLALKFPNLETLLHNASIAQLGPGDLLFVPAFYFHHVIAEQTSVSSSVFIESTAKRLTQQLFELPLEPLLAAGFAPREKMSAICAYVGHLFDQISPDLESCNTPQDVEDKRAMLDRALTSRFEGLSSADPLLAVPESMAQRLSATTLKPTTNDDAPRSSGFLETLRRQVSAVFFGNSQRPPVRSSDQAIALQDLPSSVQRVVFALQKRAGELAHRLPKSAASFILTDYAEFVAAHVVPAEDVSAFYRSFCLDDQ